MVMKKLNYYIEKIRHIVIGWSLKLFGLENDLANRRWVLCETCCKRVKTSLGDACGECGCIIDAKVRVKDEHCDLGRW
jgi:hypothetical protein